MDYREKLNQEPQIIKNKITSKQHHHFQYLRQQSEEYMKNNSLKAGIPEQSLTNHYKIRNFNMRISHSREQECKNNNIIRADHSCHHQELLISPREIKVNLDYDLSSKNKGVSSQPVQRQQFLKTKDSFRKTQIEGGFQELQAQKSKLNFYKIKQKQTQEEKYKLINPYLSQYKPKFEENSANRIYLEQLFKDINKDISKRRKQEKQKMEQLRQQQFQRSTNINFYPSKQDNQYQTKNSFNIRNQNPQKAFTLQQQLMQLQQQKLEDNHYEEKQFYQTQKQFKPNNIRMRIQEQQLNKNDSEYLHSKQTKDNTPFRKTFMRNSLLQNQQQENEDIEFPIANQFTYQNFVQNKDRNINNDYYNLHEKNFQSLNMPKRYTLKNFNQEQGYGRGRGVFLSQNNIPVDGKVDEHYNFTGSQDQRQKLQEELDRLDISLIGNSEHPLPFQLQENFQNQELKQSKQSLKKYEQKIKESDIFEKNILSDSIV